jgi:Protochlamydia outer membrane protein
MHKFWIGLIFSFSFFNGLAAECTQPIYDFEVSAGYREDYLRWDLKGPNKHLPVLSRLTWSGIGSYDIEAQYTRIICEQIYLKAKGDYGWIFRGKNRDSDYAVTEDFSHVVEFSRSDNEASKGDVLDASISIGHPLAMPEPLRQFFFMPLIGYSFHFQNLRMFHGFQTIDIEEPFSRGFPFSGLNSSYKVLWRSPWIGFDLSYYLNENTLFHGSFECHVMNYHARGHWNLRKDILGDFHHTGWGYGSFNEISVNYNFCSTWDTGCLFKFNYARVRDGKDKALWREPLSGVVVHSKGRLRNICWMSWNASLLLAYYF